MTEVTQLKATCSGAQWLWGDYSISWYTESDPWAFEIQPYEAAKYAQIGKFLINTANYCNGLELVCSIGCLQATGLKVGINVYLHTEHLEVALAKRKCGWHTINNVRFQRRDLSRFQQWTI